MYNFSTDKQKFFDNSESFVASIPTATPSDRIAIINLHTGWCMLKVSGRYAPMVFLGDLAAQSWLVENGFSLSNFDAASFQPCVGIYSTSKRLKNFTVTAKY